MIGLQPFLSFLSMYLTCCSARSSPSSKMARLSATATIMIAMIFMVMCAPSSYFAQTLYADSINTLDGTNVRNQVNFGQVVVHPVTGFVYVADQAQHVICSISPLGDMDILVGSPGVGVKLDGQGTDARLFQPRGMALNSVANIIYWSDFGSCTIRFVFLSNATTNSLYAGTCTGFTPYRPQGMTINPTYTSLYVTLGSNTLNTFALPSFVRTVKSTGSESSFFGATWLLYGGNPHLLLSTGSGCQIRLYNIADESITTLAGRNGIQGTTDGTGTNALFNRPYDIAVDPLSGDYFVADTNNYEVRRVTSTGVVTTVAGTGLNTPPSTSLINAVPALTTTFPTLYTLAFAPGGYLVVVDSDIKVLYTTAPRVPASFSVTGVTETSISLAWDEGIYIHAVTDNYTLTYASMTGQSFSIAPFTLDHTTTYTLTGLYPGFNYSNIVLYLTNKVGTVSISLGQTVRTLGNTPTPEAPVILSGTVTDFTISVTWNVPVSLALPITSYTLYVGMGASSTVTPPGGFSQGVDVNGNAIAFIVLSASTTSYTVTGLTPMTPYRFFVAASNMMAMGTLSRA
eukprot:TRINITY_DN5768_c1_g1_i1.p1 TRINITY_DN5768_c1_g1~~TRINITY_DN5768_c1_g1_i1.p1  ORF type:complete len:571 (-),score=122.83 TRINITY_DN5768_c1_g1_i1:1438-3150(-)